MGFCTSVAGRCKHQQQFAVGLRFRAGLLWTKKIYFQFFLSSFNRVIHIRCLFIHNSNNS